MSQESIGTTGAGSGRKHWAVLWDFTSRYPKMEGHGLRQGP